MSVDGQECFEFGNERLLSCFRSPPEVGRCETEEAQPNERTKFTEKKIESFFRRATTRGGSRKKAGKVELSIVKVAKHSFNHKPFTYS